MWKPGLRFQISEIGERWKDVNNDQIVWLMMKSFAPANGLRDSQIGLLPSATEPQRIPIPTNYITNYIDTLDAP